MERRGSYELVQLRALPSAGVPPPSPSLVTAYDAFVSRQTRLDILDDFVPSGTASCRSGETDKAQGCHAPTGN